MRAPIQRCGVRVGTLSARPGPPFHVRPADPADPAGRHVADQPDLMGAQVPTMAVPGLKLIVGISASRRLCPGVAPIRWTAAAELAFMPAKAHG